ncbi:hypothetical protein [Amycolatopsis thermoflava]
MSEADDDIEYVRDEYGNVIGSCNACGEELEEGEDCCDEGEFVPYVVGET